MITIIKSFFTVSEVAAILNVSAGTVYIKIHNGEIPAKKGGKSWLIPNDALEEYIASCTAAKKNTSKSKINHILSKYL